VLIQALNDPIGPIRLFACMGLWQVGAEAKAAVPALLKALNDADPSVRGQAAQALQHIDPDAAAKAGVK